MSSDSADEQEKSPEEQQTSSRPQASKLPTMLVIVVFYLILFGICGTGMLIALIAYNRI